MSIVMIVVEFDVKPERRNDFVKLMGGHAKLSQAEDGCLQFDVMIPNDSSSKVFFVERWRDQAALDVHSKLPRMAENREIYTPWLNGRSASRGTPV
ncbi:MAG TPA: putative quinol monooxygenase [Stellaceae bacterium]